MGTAEAAQFFQGLVAAGIVDARAIEDAQGQVGDDVYAVAARLARSRAGDEDALVHALAAFTDSPAARQKHFARVDEHIAALVPGRLAWKYRVVPIARTAGDVAQLVMAMRDPRDAAAIEEIEVLTGARVRPAVALDSTIGDFLQRFYGKDKPTESNRPGAPAAPDPRFAPPAVSEDSEFLELAEVPSATELASGTHALPQSSSVSESKEEPTTTAAPLPAARTLRDGPPVATIGRIIGAVAALLVVGFVAKGTLCRAKSREVDVGSQLYYAEHVKLLAQYPPGWKYLPDEDFTRNQPGMTQFGSVFYQGGDQDAPDRALSLFILDTRGALPDELSERQFMQVLDGVKRVTHIDKKGLAMRVSECTVTSARTDQTGECEGQATFKGETWEMMLYVWFEPGGFMVGAAFLVHGTMADEMPFIEAMLGTIELRVAK